MSGSGLSKAESRAMAGRYSAVVLGMGPGEEGAASKLIADDKRASPTVLTRSRRTPGLLPPTWRSGWESRQRSKRFTGWTETPLARACDFSVGKWRRIYAKRTL